MGTVMFILNLVFLALLAPSAGQSGIPQYTQGQGTIADENPQYEDTYGLAVEERMWLESPPEAVEVVIMSEVQKLMTTPESYALKEQDSDAGEASFVWKIILVVIVLLVFIVGFVCMAYYLCVWRGGRIHYRPQKGGYA